MKICTNKYYREKISAIIITYNCDKNIIRSIKQIKNQVDYIIIVDNGSNKESIDILKNIDYSEKIKIIYNNTNFGIAKALNIGAKEAMKLGSRWILTLDQDSICEKKMIDNMFAYYLSLSKKEQDKVGILVPIHKKILDNSYIKYVENKIDCNLAKEIKAEITSGNLINVDVFEKCGYFEEKLFIDYVDFEYCLRLREKGFKIVCVNNAMLYHVLGEPKMIKFLGKELIYSTHSELRHYYISRNRLYVWKKYIVKELTWVLKDFFKSIRDCVKLIFLEDEGFKKIKFACIGISDNFKNIYGKYNH